MTTPRTIEDLREILFDSLQQLKDGKMPIDRAKTIAELGQTVINTAKVEVEHIKATNGIGASRFITEPATARLPHEAEALPAETPEGKTTTRRNPQGGHRSVTTLPGVTVTRNKMA